MRLGMVGLGRMGGNMAERLRRAGHEVVGYARHGGDVGSLEELVAALEPPRVVWCMVPSGPPTEETVVSLVDLLDKGDTVVDGANSRYTDSIRRSAMLDRKRIRFVDAGVSGGVWGLENGYCMMVGGAPETVKALMPLFEALSPEGGFVHAGPVGAGHFAKMVHNGVEYAVMQGLGEGYELLKASELGIDVPATLAAWRHGSVVRSWLLDLLVDASGDIEQTRGWADDSGEGRWTVEEAVRLAVPAPAITASLFARFASRQDDPPAMKVVAALRRRFGGHATKGT